MIKLHIQLDYQVFLTSTLDCLFILSLDDFGRHFYNDMTPGKVKKTFIEKP